MRELTLAECESVSGGHLVGCDSACTVTRVGDITVVGSHPPPGGGFVPPNMGGGESGGSGGTGDDGDDCGCPASGGATDQATRSAAADAGDMIRDQNWENQEYGGFLYRDNVTGEIKAGPITGGGIDGWSPSSDNMLGITSWSQIVGVIHNHGPNIEGSNHNYPSTKDWNAFDSLKGMGLTNLTAFYILGEDGKVREYKTDNRDTDTPGDDVTDC
ncbi:hypothetical protein D3C87_618470 [compost metagenome]